MTAIAAVNDHHRRCRTFDNNDHQKPAVIVRHDNDRHRRLHPTATSVDNDRRGQRPPSLPLT